jgi:CspA family cold shock protein
MRRENAMATGIVKWYDPDKGYGFVSRDEGGDDLFLHHTMVGTEIVAEGDRISFSVGYGLKGERAENIEVVERGVNPPRERRPREFRATDDSRRPSVDPLTLPRLEGVVQRYDTAKGFGFIRSTENPDDVFFHGSIVVGSPVHPGDAVEFRLGEGPKGPRAQQVRLLVGDDG